jgi:hypothetical protein
MSIDCDPHRDRTYRIFCKSANLFALGGSRGLVVAAAARVALTDASSFASQSTKIIKFGSPHSASLDEVDMIDDGRVEGKNSFDANPEARLSHCYSFAGAAMFARDHHAFKSL